MSEAVKSETVDEVKAEVEQVKDANKEQSALTDVVPAVEVKLEATTQVETKVENDSTTTEVKAEVVVPKDLQAKIIRQVEVCCNIINIYI